MGKMKKSSSKKPKEHDEKILLDGQVNNFTLVDSVSCSGSVGSSNNDNLRLQLLKAQIVEEERRRELELELFKASNVTRLARLRLEQSEGGDFGPIAGCSTSDVTVKDSHKSVTFQYEHKGSTNLAERAAPMLPRVELQYFDGNICQYWKFIRQFENFIESNVFDEGQRMLYLLHYCRGQARDAIDGCSMLPPEFAYKRAREILTELYGQSHAIARSMIDRLTSCLSHARTNGVSLTQLSIEMQNCETALSQMNYEGDLDSLTTLELIVYKLPYELQDRWARLVDVINQGNRQPKFHDLQRFIADEARICRSRFGQIATKSNVKTMEKTSRDFARVHATVNRTGQFQSNLDSSCYVCGDKHDLDNCDMFKSYDVTGRWNVVKKYQACFLCLLTGHRAIDCRKNVFCSVSGCNGRHNYLLHMHKEGSDQNLLRCNSMSARFERVRLGTFPVTVLGPRGAVDTYAMLDNGSDVSLVKSSLLVELGIQPEKEVLHIRTLNSDSHLESGTTELSLAPLGCDKPTVVIQRAFCVSDLPRNNCYSAAIDAKPWEHLNDLDLPDIPNHSVGLLIGADVPEAHGVLEQRFGRPNEPFAYLTTLGWVVLGPVNSQTTRNKLVLSVQREFTDVTEQLKIGFVT